MSPGKAFVLAPWCGGLAALTGGEESPPSSLQFTKALRQGTVWQKGQGDANDCECRLPGSPTRYPWLFLADTHSVSTGVLPRCRGGRKDKCGACLAQLTTRQS